MQEKTNTFPFLETAGLFFFSCVEKTKVILIGLIFSKKQTKQFDLIRIYTEYRNKPVGFIEVNQIIPLDNSVMECSKEGKE